MEQEQNEDMWKHSEEEDKEYSIIDPESGHRYKVTKEQHESYMAMWEMCRPKINSDKIVGRVICTGTKGELDDSWSEWFTSNKWKTE